MNTLPLNRHGMVRPLTALVIIAGMLFAGSSLTAQATSEQARPKKDLVGTWRMTVTLYNCTTGAEQPPFQSMISFAQGGTLTDTTASPAFQPGQRSPGHGIWMADGKHAFKFISEAYILFSTEAKPPVPGFQRGLQRITQTVEIKDGKLVTDGIVEFFDVAGNLVMSGCAKAVGEPLK